MILPLTPLAASRKGFTLIELMIVVAIIGILAAVAIPKFADMLRKSKEGVTKGNLGSLRSALNIYSSDNEGIFPSDNLACLTAQAKYIDALPTAKTAGYHSESDLLDNNDTQGQAGLVMADDGKWKYWNWPNPFMSKNQGMLWLGCSHTDTKNAPITSW